MLITLVSFIDGITHDNIISSDTDPDQFGNFDRNTDTFFLTDILCSY
jgi:hypothetical protein